MNKILIALFVPLILISCGQNNKNNQTTEEAVVEAKVKIYYFHGKQRCKSCVAIQKVAEETFNETYKNNKDVMFKEVDFSLKENDALAEKYEVAWSSLIIASNEKYENLTDIAFANALSNPQVVKEEIIKQTNILLTN